MQSNLSHRAKWRSSRVDLLRVRLVPVRYVDANTTCELDTNYVIIIFIFVNDIFIHNLTHVASRTRTTASFIIYLCFLFKKLVVS
ncbi:hypothetical protein AAZX31_11G184000 [Glycine max]